MSRDDFCYVTTRGRRTGQPHRIEIWYARISNTLYLLSGGGKQSDWVRNLIAYSSCQVELDENEYSATARILDKASEEESMARRKVFEKYAPRYEGDLTEWRDSALPVALDLE